MKNVSVRRYVQGAQALGASALLLLGAMPLWLGATNAAQAQATGTQALPTVVIERPRRAKRKQAGTQKQRVRAPRNTVARSPPPPSPAEPGSSGPAETAYGPVQGYIATQSATGTKTDTPLHQTPQSISVVTAD